MQIQIFSKTDIGRKRSNNEDSLLVEERLGLYAVADGMGGHAAGEVASAMALEIVKKEMGGWSGVLDDYTPDSSAEVRDVILNLIEETVQRACQAVFQEGVDNPDRQGMGTTLSLVLMRSNSAFFGHVGDSRIYLVRGGSVHQLTEDHSLATEMLKLGRIRRSDSDKKAYQNVITRAVGCSERVRVDTLQMDLLPGDRLLLCTDGLHDYLRPEEVEAVLIDGPMEEATDRFVNLANQRGGKDNITLVLIAVAEDDIVSAHDLHHRMEVMRKAPLLKYLNYREMIALMNASYLKKLSEGETIARAGESGDELFVLTRGEARLLVEEQEVARLREGAHFGEIAMFSSTPRTSSVQAVEPGELLVIGREQFYRFLHREPLAGLKIIWRLVQLTIQRTTMTEAQRLVEDLSPEWMLPEKQDPVPDDQSGGW